MRMTLEQLTVFVAVAEREHLTRAAEAIHHTPSAVSAAIRNLENQYGVALFHRVGRRIELTDTGRVFLHEARATLARARAAELVLSEMAGLQRGTLSVYASQTISSYWLPQRLMQFRSRYPGISLEMTIGNTRTVADAVMEGQADLGFVEGELDEPLLGSTVIAEDRLVVVVAPDHPWSTASGIAFPEVTGTLWIMRERGSGTRSVFESALAAKGVDSSAIQVGLVLPSNEAILSAVVGSHCAAAVSELAAQRHIDAGLLVRVDLALPARAFRLLRHKERHGSRAAEELIRIAAAGDDRG